ncbi:MAG: DUF2975 domain-containing protein [Actinobacteria bacterium]|nr:DUF2975 domain-containing protein [Actinomycetota bacterium]MBV8959235.1 DUF2975 domain-containing protein [Actinomycetota bacterium]MBV9256215.1 DUF2975 domain-containing protein [Actinomycetota bacterium]MBV9662498.1 DUF2975 domain-containing protein [Actinomycetota bacterium]MBV9935769.1 DUF2975 domain-containing protein [Actinomycetota bacterium]
MATLQAGTRPTRFLAALSTVLLVVAIAFGVFVFAGAVFGFGPNGHEVAAHAQVGAKQVVDLPNGAVAPEHVDVLVRVRHATHEQQRWAAARDLVSLALVIAILWLLRGLLRSVRDGNPFNDTNVIRLRGLALLVLIGVPVADLLSSTFAGELASSAGLTGSGTHLGMPGNALLGGLALFVLAEVFAAGVRMRADLEGTV